MATVVYRGLDCDAPPNYAALKAQGFDFVGRYLAPHDNPLTRAELVEAAAADVGIVALGEHTTNDVAAGASGGKTNAAQWIASMHDLGAASGAAIVAACDEDPSIVGEGAARLYYGAVESACRSAQFMGGAYGGAALMGWLSQVVSVLMQSGAWSGGVQAPGIDLFQEIATVTIDGIEFDVDEAFSKNFGAFNANGLWPVVPAPPDPKPAPTPIPKPTPAPLEDDVTTIDVPLGIGSDGQGTYTTAIPFADVVSVTAEFGEGSNPAGTVGFADSGGDAVIVGKGWAKGSLTVRVAYSTPA